MSSRTVRRLILGFAAGAFAGWLGGLLRSPADAPLGSSAADAAELPQERFGDAPGELRPTPGPGIVPATVATSSAGAGAAGEQQDADHGGYGVDDAPAPRMAVAAPGPDMPDELAPATVAPAKPARQPRTARSPSVPSAPADLSASGRPTRKPRTKRVKGTTTVNGASRGDIAADDGAADGDTTTGDAGSTDPAGGG